MSHPEDNCKGSNFLKQACTDGATGPTGPQGPTGPGGTPGGSDTQIQYNEATAFAGDSNLIYNYTDKYLSGVSGVFDYLSGATGYFGDGNTTTFLVSGENVGINPDSSRGMLSIGLPLYPNGPNLPLALRATGGYATTASQNSVSIRASHPSSTYYTHALGEDAGGSGFLFLTTLEGTPGTKSAMLSGNSLSLQERGAAAGPPPATDGYGQIYTKADNKLYFLDGAGVEHEVSLV